MKFMPRSVSISPQPHLFQHERGFSLNVLQNTDKIHALDGLVSLAAAGGVSVHGGNVQIFENFVKESKANVFLKTTVRSMFFLTSALSLLNFFFFWIS